jgi:hypothetical protein
VILQEITNSTDLRATPVIIVTGSDPSPVVAQATAIVRKPCPPEQLLSIIEKLPEAA